MEIKTENRLATMETKLDNLIEDVKEIGKDIKEFDSKYSGKWVEKAIIGICSTIIAGIVLYFFNNK